MDYVKYVKDLVNGRVGTITTRKEESPLETLRGIGYRIPITTSVNQMEIAKENVVLGLEGCLGRMVFSGAVIAKYFPQTKIEVAEIQEDFFQNLLLGKLKGEPFLKYDYDFVEELLMYEEPHMVIRVDGEQFDPLETVYGERVIHPKIKIFPFWEAVTSSMLVSLSFLEGKDYWRKYRILVEAETICPGTMLVRENMVHSLMLLGLEEQAMELLQLCQKERPCARSLYVLYRLTDNPNHKKELLRKYGVTIFDHLQPEEV